MCLIEYYSLSTDSITRATSLPALAHVALMATQNVDISTGKEELHADVLVQISNANAHLTLQNLGHVLNLVTDTSLMIEQVV